MPDDVEELQTRLRQLQLLSQGLLEGERAAIGVPWIITFANIRRNSSEPVCLGVVINQGRGTGAVRSAGHRAHPSSVLHSLSKLLSKPMPLRRRAAGRPVGRSILLKRSDLRRLLLIGLRPGYRAARVRRLGLTRGGLLGGSREGGPASRFAVPWSLRSPGERIFCRPILMPIPRRARPLSIRTGTGPLGRGITASIWIALIGTPLQG